MNISQFITEIDRSIMRQLRNQPIKRRCEGERTIFHDPTGQNGLETCGARDTRYFEPTNQHLCRHCWNEAAEETLDCAESAQAVHDLHALVETVFPKRRRA